MNIQAKLASFPAYLIRIDPSICEVFGDQGSLGLRSDPDNLGEYKLMILLGSDNYTEGQAHKLFTLWNTYKGLPEVS